MADRNNQAAFLGQGNELRRGNQAALRVLPTQQGLKAEDLLVGVDYRLVEQAQLILLQGQAQVPLQQGALVDFALQGVIEEAQLVAPGILSLV